MNKFVLDTNIIIKYLDGNSSVTSIITNEELIVSFVTEIELMSWPAIDKSSKEAFLQFLSQCYIQDYNADLTYKVINFRKQYRLKLADAFIVATAIQRNCRLITADRDLKKVTAVSSIIII